MIGGKEGELGSPSPDSMPVDEGMEAKKALTSTRVLTEAGIAVACTVTSGSARSFIWTAVTHFLRTKAFLGAIAAVMTGYLRFRGAVVVVVVFEECVLKVRGGYERIRDGIYLKWLGDVKSAVS
jgi:hypothetical protein